MTKIRVTSYFDCWIIEKEIQTQRGILWITQNQYVWQKCDVNGNSTFLKENIITFETKEHAKSIMREFKGY